MPDPHVHNESLHAGEPVAIGDVRLLAIEKISIRSDRGRTGLWVRASKELFAVIVRDPGGMRAYDPYGAAVSVETLAEEVSGLDELLASM
jgi:hypothetical protein